MNFLLSVMPRLPEAWAANLLHVVTASECAHRSVSLIGSEIALLCKYVRNALLSNQSNLDSVLICVACVQFHSPEPILQSVHVCRVQDHESMTRNHQYSS